MRSKPAYISKTGGRADRKANGGVRAPLFILVVDGDFAMGGA